VQFPLIIAWLLPLGGVALRRRNSAAFAAVGVLGIVCVTYCVNYRIDDIQAYYIPALLSLTIFAACGLQWLTDSLNRHKSAVVVMSCGAMLLVTYLGVTNYKSVDKSDAYWIKDYADNVLRTVRPNSLLIACGDAPYNCLLYEKVVHNVRQDVILVERNVLRTWRPYNKRSPSESYLLAEAQCAPEIGAAYYRGHYSRIQVSSEEMLAGLIAEAMKVRPVYLTCVGENGVEHPILAQVEKTHQLVPEGVVYRVLPKDQNIDYRALAAHNESLWAGYRLDRIYDGSIGGDEFEREIPSRYSSFHVRLGEIETDAGMYAQASANFRKALAINPYAFSARNGLAVALIGIGRTDEAMREWRTILQYIPNDKAAQHNLRIAEQRALGAR
jgi:tetratricopeptide (TPR) repeat protein